MTKYRVIVNRELCTSCACASGRCPTHARTLSRLLKNSSCHGTIESEYIEEVQKAARLCPEGAIKIECIT